MRKSIRSELRMLREMLWHFGLVTKCHFCHKPLLEFYNEITGATEPEFGERSCPPVKTTLTIHHKNENHKDNRKKNRKPAHSACHKRYHARQQHKRGGLNRW
jgi:hypothetical protein